MTTTSWFSQLFGFEEADYGKTQSLLKAEGDYLHILTDPPKRLRMGRLETPSLGELRLLCEHKSISGTTSSTKQKHTAQIRISNIAADARDLHLLPEADGAVIQMASQFNLLEMPAPSVSPEAGISGYIHDRTQGPACAMAAAAATLYRNYLVPVGDSFGQIRDRQVNALADLDRAIGIPGIEMQNGYAMLKADTASAIGEYLTSLGTDAIDELRRQLRIGVHWGAGVTLPEAAPNQSVTHALCSALPVAYNQAPVQVWEPFARLVLEATYEATLRAAVLNHQQTGNPRVYLTFVGGGVFGNRREWILDAMERAIHAVAEHPLEVFWVSYRSVQADVKTRVAAIIKTLASPSA